MTEAQRQLVCPQCRRALGEESWISETECRCMRCTAEFEAVIFPALTAETASPQAHAAVLDAESVCFFHATNRAQALCDGCGRLLCAVCSVPFMGRVLCPTCVAVAAQKPASQPFAVPNRVNHDSIALSLAVVPLIIFVVTLVTAPIALGYVVYSWNKPRSLIRPGPRWRLGVAALFAIAEIVGWIVVFTNGK